MKFKFSLRVRKSGHSFPIHYNTKCCGRIRYVAVAKTAEWADKICAALNRRK